MAVYRAETPSQVHLQLFTTFHDQNVIYTTHTFSIGSRITQTKHRPKDVRAWCQCACKVATMLSCMLLYSVVGCCFFLAQILFSLFPSLSLSAPLIVQHVYVDEGWWLYSLILYFQTPKFCSFIEIIKSETDCAIKRTKKLNDASNQINELLCIQHKISYYVHIDNTERATVFHNTKPTHWLTLRQIAFNL